MKRILITGACGFVGRNLTRRLVERGQHSLLLIDDLSAGIHPDLWLGLPLTGKQGAMHFYGKSKEVLFLHQDLRNVLRYWQYQNDYFKRNYDVQIERFSHVYHLAAIIGGRSVIETDPMLIAQNLAIDAEFFYWASRGYADKVLYPSSSAAYPLALQKATDAAPLREQDIHFSRLGQPDLVYGWAKLTGEYLAQITSQKYGVSIACVRPFSGYGEDQALSYPIPAIVNRFVQKEDPLVVWGDGLQQRDFVHIEDVLDAFELAIEQIHDGSAVNISSGVATSFLDVIRILKEISEHYPEVSTQLGKPTGVRSRSGDPGFALVRLGWSAKVPLKEGLERVYQYLLNK